MPEGPVTIHSIEERLSSDEDEVRYRAVPRILELDDEAEVRRLLVRCLGDESWRVRKAASEKLADLEDLQGAIDALVAALADEDNAGMRNAAAEVLTKIGRDSIETLSARLNDPDRDVRKLVVDILGEIAHPSTIDVLIERLDDSDENVRGAAAEALGKVGGEKAKEALERLLEGTDLLTTMSALDALARTGAMVPLTRLEPLLSKRLLRRPVLVLLARLPEKDALEGILDALADPSRGTREAGLSALARWGDAHDRSGERLKTAVAHRDPQSTAKVARSALSSDDVWSRAAAFDLISFAKEFAAAPSIIHAARDERLRDRALEAIRRMGFPAADSILGSVDHMPPRLQSLALEALALLEDESVVPGITRFLEHDDDELRLAAVDALRHIGSAQAVEPLARLLGAVEPPLSSAVVRALADLARVAPDEVRDACRLRIEDEDSARVADACRVLSAMGSTAEIPLLRTVLGREDPRAREAAAEALGNLRGEEALVQLRYALADEAPSVRAVAARSLGKHGGAEVSELLLVALGDDDPVVVGAAAEALGAQGDPSIGPRLLSILGDPESPGPSAAAFAALRALAMLRAPQLDQAISRAAVHPEGEVAKEAVSVAKGLGSEAGRQVLLACARHPRWDVRYAAVKALAKTRDASLMDDLRAMAETETDEMVAEELAEAVRSLAEMIP